MINVSHHPAATTRIAADGNCFVSSMSLVITRSQGFHQELRLLITTHMILLTASYLSLLNAIIYVYAQCGDSCKWLKHEQMKLAVVCTEMKAYM